jgi:peptide/nickel transport system permease protein
MLKMILQRLLLGLITIGLVSIIIFAAVEILPGDACTAVLQRDAQGLRLENCRNELGLNRPAHVRYLEWAGGALRGDFGVLANSDKRISDLVGDRVKNSLLLGVCALAAGLPLAFIFGILAALRRDKPLDLIVSGLAISAMTIPEFVSATILILVFSGWLGWLPGIVLTSANAPVAKFFPEILLPVVVLSMVMTAHILRTVRSSVIEVLDSDYVRMATLKGVPYRSMILRHVLPNALLPAINVVALTVAWLLGGVVVIETVFNYPGLGRLMISAISDRDLGLVQAIALIIASVYVVVNLTADLLTLFANPRLRTAMVKRA